MQVADVIVNNVEAPNWVFNVTALLLGIGFPFAIAKRRVYTLSSISQPKGIACK